MTAPPMLASDHIRELLYPFSSFEIVMGGVHRVRHLGLLDQIQQTVTSGGVRDQSGHAAYGSRPAGRIECLDYLSRVERQSRQMLDRPGLRTRLRELSVILGLTQNARVRSWWVSARVLTQHDIPSHVITTVCPSCDHFVTIHVRLNPNVAFCVGCGETWTEERFYELGEWVRWNTSGLSETGVAFAPSPKVSNVATAAFSLPST